MDRLRLLQIIRGEDRSILAGMVRLGLSILEPGYRLAVLSRNQTFNLGLRRPARLPRPVLSVGNITTGGTGKTPLVINLAQQLLAMGQRPAILLRGYALPSLTATDEKTQPKSIDRCCSNHPHSAAPSSDEARLLADALGSSVPVQANPNRVAGAAQVLQRCPQTTLFLLDDGFQHRQAHRDLDLVLLDATAPFGGGHLLPRGLLREPLASLRRADALILTRADLAEPQQIAEIHRKLQRVGVALPIASTAHRWDGFLDAHDQPAAPDQLRTLRVAGICGIGNPWAFKTELARQFAQVTEIHPLQDHQTYTPQLIRQLDLQARDSKAQALVLTEKDWVKWRAAAGDQPTLPIYRPRLQIAWLQGLERVQALLRQRLIEPQTTSQPIS